MDKALIKRFAILLSVIALLPLTGRAQDPSGLAAADTNIELESGGAALDRQKLDRQREQFQQAINALRGGKLRSFAKLKEELADYPLYPYLVYYELLRRLNHLPEEDIKHFIQSYPDTPLAWRLQDRWLDKLARRGRWEQYLTNFDPANSNTELYCYALWARHKGGDTQAVLEAVKPLWLVGHSQPDACDPVFNLWQDAGHLTPELGWDRFILALEEGNYQLAKYLIRFVAQDKQSTAELYRELYLYPERISRHRATLMTADRGTQIITAVISRLARRDAEAAAATWRELTKDYLAKAPLAKDYPQENVFVQSARLSIEKAIILGMARENKLDTYRELLAAYPYSADAQILEAGIEMALRLQDWNEVRRGIEHLPEPLTRTARWRYWYARSLQQATSRDDQLLARNIFSELALERDYYGFLAADRMQADYRLNAEASEIDPGFLDSFSASAAIRRAEELRYQGQMTEARREWFYATRELTNLQHYTAAHYAMKIGWYEQAIRSAIKSEHWNDLDLRFPLSLEPSIAPVADARKVDSNWILAVARQESAFTPDVRSSRGAVGLMQLLPSTAKSVARKYDIPLRHDAQLTDSDINISLGSAYISELMRQFDNNAIYATAAYNAGPHRVKQWQRDIGEQPLDVWIENIPFSETRNYVKNVLTYSVIFAQRRGQFGFRMATADYLKVDMPILIKTE